MSVVLSEHLPLLASAPDGIQKLRGLILELAVRGKLVPQDPNDEPASELFKRIAAEKVRLVAEGKIKKDKPLPPLGEDERPFAIPESWQWTRLTDIASFENGDRSKNYPSRDEFVPAGIPFINAGHLRDRRVDFSDMNFIPQQRFDALRAGKTRKGDILFCLRGSLGKFGIICTEEPAAIASSLVIIRAVQAASLEYLESYLSSPIITGQISRFDNGTAQPNLGAADLIKFVFPLPPLAEQHRIVAKVDELMALCDRLEAEQADAASAHARLVETLLGTLTQSRDATELAANWQRLIQHFATLFTTEASLDALKQTILQLAVMGKLVPQDPNDEPASELLKRIAAEKARLVAEGKIKKDKPLPQVGESEEPFLLPESWQWIRFGQLEPEYQNGESSRGVASGTKIVVLRLADISNGGISLSNTRSVVLPESSIAKYRLSKNDVLIIRVNGSAEIVGRLILCTENLAAIYCDHFIRVRISEVSICHRYLRLIGDAPAIRNQIQSLFITTAGQKTVNQSHIGGLRIPLPPLPEQHRIVAKVDELLALCDRLQADLADSRAQQARLATTLIEYALEAA